MKNYYQLSSEEVKQEINGKQEPLTSAEVKAHQEKFGRTNWWKERRKPHFRSFWSNTKISL